MDFELTDEQRLIQDTVRDFVDRKVLPNAVENDIEHKLDMSVIEGMAELGLLGIVIPEEYGGAGLDFVAEALSCEEIERGEAAFRTLISSTSASTRSRCSGTRARSRSGVTSSPRRAARSSRASG